MEKSKEIENRSRPCLPALRTPHPTPRTPGARYALNFKTNTFSASDTLELFLAWKKLYTYCRGCRYWLWYRNLLASHPILSYSFLSPSPTDEGSGTVCCYGFFIYLYHPSHGKISFETPSYFTKWIHSLADLSLSHARSRTSLYLIKDTLEKLKNSRQVFQTHKLNYNMKEVTISLRMKSGHRETRDTTCERVNTKVHVRRSHARQHQTVACLLFEQLAHRYTVSSWTKLCKDVRCKQTDEKTTNYWSLLPLGVKRRCNNVWGRLPSNRHTLQWLLWNKIKKLND